MSVNQAFNEIKKKREKAVDISYKDAMNLKPSVGMMYAEDAITTLRQIKKDDEQRTEALNLVKEYIQDEL